MERRKFLETMAKAAAAGAGLALGLDGRRVGAKTPGEEDISSDIPGRTKR